MRIPPGTTPIFFVSNSVLKITDRNVYEKRQFIALEASRSGRIECVNVLTCTRVLQVVYVSLRMNPQRVGLVLRYLIQSIRYITGPVRVRRDHTSMQ